MLIGDVELTDGGRADVRIEHGLIAAVGRLMPAPGEPAVAGARRLLLPGLHDHHIHLAALAAALQSVACGPPEVNGEADLAAALDRPGAGWLRGTGYHESVAGMLDAATIDRWVSDRPVRIQHRGGRMWFLNTIAIEQLLQRATTPAGLDRTTGRLFDEDEWLRQALGTRPPELAEVGALLARHGVTGVTDMTPANDAVIADHLGREQARGALPQRVLLAGRPSLSPGDMIGNVRLGPVKLHLHEAALPSHDGMIATIAAAHDAGRALAVHCVTEVELVLTLAAFVGAGTMPGDRIEHAAIATDDAVAEIARLGLAVVSQPHFIPERGDRYRRDVAPGDQPLLYRLRAFADAGVTLAAGSDAPFGGPDPWRSMAAAVARTTASGIPLGAAEALTPEAALDLYLAAPEQLDRQRAITVGAPADLVLIDRGWRNARADLAAVGVVKTWIGGRLVHDRVDQPPA